MDRVMGSGRWSQWEMVDEKGWECMDWSVESGQWSQWEMEALSWVRGCRWMGVWVVVDVVSGKWRKFDGDVGADECGFGWEGVGMYGGSVESGQWSQWGLKAVSWGYGYDG